MKKKDGRILVKKNEASERWNENCRHLMNVSNETHDAIKARGMAGMKEVEE